MVNARQSQDTSHPDFLSFQDQDSGPGPLLNSNAQPGSYDATVPTTPLLAQSATSMPSSLSQQSSRKRPSTAPAADLKLPLLPSAKLAPSFKTLTSNVPPTPVSDFYSSSQGSTSSIPLRDERQDVDRLVTEAFGSGSTDATTGYRSSLAATSSLSPPTSVPDLEITCSPSADGFHSSHTYDWNTFVTAYAKGQWDPTQIPLPPRPTITSPLPVSHSEHPSPQNDLVTRSGILRRAMTSSSSSGTAKLTEQSHSGSESALDAKDVKEEMTRVSSTDVPSKSSVYEGTLAERRSQPQLSNPLHRTRRSDTVASGTRSALASPSNEMFPTVASSTSSARDSAALAATLRWASSGVSTLRPLALPSPERELTDPMRRTVPKEVTVVKTSLSDRPLPSPAQTRSTISPEAGMSDTQLSPNVVTPDENQDSVLHPSTSGGGALMSRMRLAPATAPAMAGPKDVHGLDYFSSMSRTLSQIGPSEPGDSTDSFQAHSGDAAPARAELSRHISEPLPSGKISFVPRQTIGSLSTSFPKSVKPLEGVKHPPQEDFYYENRWLVAPVPLDEAERLRALYRYNIMYTTKDTNFDRITHLGKLVFQTKGVAISLVDSTMQWFKAEAGTSLERTHRNESLCSHTILQRSDEPVVVLDTMKDWRFAANPLVLDGPRIRFYAGAPLRTSSGYNVGTLCLLDDQPRSEFTPRNRHALKEFASIIMREMELWQDKIQLRMRDRIQLSMERFTRECLEVDGEPGSSGESAPLGTRGAMERIYVRAANLVKSTLDVEGACVMDVSRSGLHDASSDSEGQMSITLYSAGETKASDGHGLTSEDYSEIVAFFSKHPDGVVTDGLLPSWFRHVLPDDILHALIVPIFNIDQRPFALLVAYNTTILSKNYLDGHEMSYLRAIGVIILSAVLKRRMILADKAKSLFISNISHELRTPLHGILAAAELLAESPLNHHQQSFLQTVQACGASLVETVNHVLDYTKLSGNTRAGGLENMIPRAKVDLMQVIEEAVEGCWVGFRARTPSSSSADIGTFYSPPSTSDNRGAVETVIDVDLRRQGWWLICEKGGIRRVLMNLIGNSLKFTTRGYIQVALKRIAPLATTPEGSIRVEISVSDTGKGISAEFLRTQLFEPFSQENPLQTGTGLGLAIVKSIVNSKSVSGKLELSSTEGAGTDMRVSFDAEVVSGDGAEDFKEEEFGIDNDGRPILVQLLAFDRARRGSRLLEHTLSKYLTDWWGFKIATGRQIVGEILVIDEDGTVLKDLQKSSDCSKPVVVLSSTRGDTKLMALVEMYEQSSGFCRVLYKPDGPSRLRHVMKMCVNVIKIRHGSQAPTSLATPFGTPVPDQAPTPLSRPKVPTTPRRHSEEYPMQPMARPNLGQRSFTYHQVSAEPESGRDILPSASDLSTASSAPSSPGLTVSIGTGAMLLKSSINTLIASQGPRVLIVEDNDLLRNLLAKWLTSKGFEYQEAVDGQQAVEVFRDQGPFDIVLIDVSMPVLDGIGATTEMRKLEAARTSHNSALRHAGHSIQDNKPARILALTGMSALEDKRKAFEAGVDGYLVKPVAFKTLNLLFQQLGLSG